MIHRRATQFVVELRIPNKLRESITPGIAHVLAVANVTVHKPIGSDVIILAGNLHVSVKISLSL